MTLDSIVCCSVSMKNKGSSTVACSLSFYLLVDICNGYEKYSWISIDFDENCNNSHVNSRFVSSGELDEGMTNSLIIVSSNIDKS